MNKTYVTLEQFDPNAGTGGDDTASFQTACTAVSKENFMAQYTAKSRADHFNNGDLVALPCTCGEESCTGWAAVSNNSLSIKAHNGLYASTDEVKP